MLADAFRSAAIAAVAPLAGASEALARELEGRACPLRQAAEALAPDPARLELMARAADLRPKLARAGL